MQESDQCVSFLKRHTLRLAYPKTRIPAREMKLALKETMKWNAKKQTFSPQGRVRAPC